MRPKCVEFYCGIGGFAAAVAAPSGRAADRDHDGETDHDGDDDTFGCGREPIAAWDIDCAALSVYRLNFPTHVAKAAEIRSLRIDRLAGDLWWLSPPCLPFSRKGKQRDSDDPRTESLVALIGKVSQGTPFPNSLVIENVPPFATSRTGEWVWRHLEAAGFHCTWETRCPTELGWPMRRLRTYLIASRQPLRPLAIRPHAGLSLRSFLDAENDADPDLAVPEGWLVDYRRAIDLVDADDPHAVASCFTSSYGRMPVRSGSYLRLSPGEPLQARFFSPDELLRLLGFPPWYRWPDAIPRRRRWAMAGNSLSLPVVRWVLSRLPAC